MEYYFSKKITGDFNSVIEKVTEELKTDGFGVLTDIDVKATFKKKIDVDFRNYRILGACNPNFAFKAISSEPNIGVFLPCNVVVQETESGEILVSAVDPVASMTAVDNNNLGEIATQVQSLLKGVIERV